MNIRNVAHHSTGQPRCAQLTAKTAAVDRTSPKQQGMLAVGPNQGRTKWGSIVASMRLRLREIESAARALSTPPPRFLFILRLAGRRCSHYRRCGNKAPATASVRCPNSLTVPTRHRRARGGLCAGIIQVLNVVGGILVSNVFMDQGIVGIWLAGVRLFWTLNHAKTSVTSCAGIGLWH